jgi:hypothetical protein
MSSENSSRKAQVMNVGFGTALNGIKQDISILRQEHERLDLAVALAPLQVKLKNLKLFSTLR